jgi:bile acid-coenzyme A ligase
LLIARAIVVWQVIACFAAWKLGATPNNINHALTFRERDAIVRLANPTIVVGVPSLREPTMPTHEGYRCLPEGYTPSPSLSAMPLPDTYANSWLVATSGGSTGRPKLSTSPHRLCSVCGPRTDSCLAAGRSVLLNEPSIITMKDIGGGRLAMADGFAIDGGGNVNGVDLVPCPLSHNAPFYCAVQGVLSASHQVLLTRFDAEWMLRLIEEYRCTFSYCVPAHGSHHARTPTPCTACFSWTRAALAACCSLTWQVPTVMKRVWDLPEHIRLKYDISSLQGVFHMAAPCVTTPLPRVAIPDLMPPRLIPVWQMPSVAQGGVVRVARPEEDLGALRRDRGSGIHADPRRRVAAPAQVRGDQPCRPCGVRRAADPRPRDGRAAAFAHDGRGVDAPPRAARDVPLPRREQQAR